MRRDPNKASVSPHWRRSAWLVICGSVALALWSLVQQHRDFTRMPSSETTIAGNLLVREGFTHGDVIRNLPWWFDDARLGLPGLPVLVTRELDEYDRHRFDRMWLLYATAYEADAARERAWFASYETVFDAGGYRIDVGPIAPGPRQVLWDAFSDLESAEVMQIDIDGRHRPCDLWTEDAWHCGRPDRFIFIGRVIREMDDVFRYCISSTAPPDGRRWRVTWNDVPLGNDLRVRAGNTSWGARQYRGSPVELTVMLDSEPVVTHVFPRNTWGYPEFVVDTGARRGSTGEVTVELYADDHMDRFFCFRAQTTQDR